MCVDRPCDVECPNMMRPIAECGVGRASTHRVKGVSARGRVWGGFCVETSTYAVSRVGLCRMGD